MVGEASDSPGQQLHQPCAQQAVSASTQAQLSVLRAELAASDAELEHVLAHCSILQRQQQHAGVPAGHAAVAAMVSGSQAQASEVEFLREVRTVRLHMCERVFTLLTSATERRPLGLLFAVTDAGLVLLLLVDVPCWADACRGCRPCSVRTAATGGRPCSCS